MPLSLWDVLIPEEPFMIMPDLARVVGLEKAVLIQELQDWIRIDGQPNGQIRGVWDERDTLAGLARLDGILDRRATLAELAGLGIVKIEQAGPGKWYWIDHARLNEMAAEE